MSLRSLDAHQPVTVPDLPGLEWVDPGSGNCPRPFRGGVDHFAAFPCSELPAASSCPRNRASGISFHSGFVWFLALIACTLISCTRTEESPDATILAARNCLRLDIPAPIPSLDPTREESGSTYVFNFLYDSLFSMNERGEFVPELADAYNYDPIEFAWTIHLKKGPRFHNGKAVKASDVIYSLRQRLRNLRPDYYVSVKEIVARSDESVLILLNKDDPKFLFKIFATEIVPEAAYGSVDYYNHPIGSGPFVFEYRDGEKDVGLAAYNDYHKGKPSLDRVLLHFEPDNEKSWARLIRGETDAAFGIHPVDYSMLADHRETLHLSATGNPSYSILLFNMHDPLFQSINLRKALSLAIDKDAIVKDVLKGYGQVAVGPFEPDSPYHDRGLDPVPYNPREGLRLLEQDGWVYDEDGKYLHRNGTPLEFTILYAGKDRMMKGVAESLQLNLNDIGVKARLIPVSLDDLVRRYIHNTEFQAVLTEMHPSIESPESLRDIWSPIGSEKSSAGCFENSDLTKILEEAASETRPERVTELYREAEALIVSLYPGTFLFNKTTLDVISRRIEFPHPFSSWGWDVHRLRSASVGNLDASGK